MIVTTGARAQLLALICASLSASSFLFELVVADRLGDVPHLLDDQRRGVLIDDLVDRHHGAHVASAP